ncbi:helix-turn-helix transcriptional regulator [Fodinibius halophilus]|uniref:Response regulator transcription factor n=1 Tax=Fodinibius halophilus TaxID=1736908 RepID=A0A6M1T3R5_9BACT|nr:LuxR C-terminal-related transcriptional regulator [Fodinibius halophilus]NGP88717.1 response regulator transcription factor [Fodinibius halophilus]
MNKNERWIITVVLLVIAVLTSIDIYNDYFEGVAGWHISIESIVGIIALIGVFYLVRGRFQLQQSLVEEQQFSKEVQQEARKWRQVSKKYVEGLSVVIENQLDRWELTEAEKEIAFLLLKGLSNKEIANVRNTSVQTVRSQTNAIYTKSGLSGRSELSAFFLEDLLLPTKEGV